MVKLPPTVRLPPPLIVTFSSEMSDRTDWPAVSSRMVGLLCGMLITALSFVPGTVLPLQLAASDQWLPSPRPVQARGTGPARLIFSVLTLYAGIVYSKLLGLVIEIVPADCGFALALV